MQQFILEIEPAPDQGLATLRLTDEHGRQLGFQQVRFADHPASRWEGLFDTGAYLARYADNLTPAGRAEPYSEQELLAELGLFLGREVLGGEIMQALEGAAHRTLLLRLPRAEDPLTAGLARLPWEIARSAPDQPPLTDRNLVPRLLLADSSPETQATTLDLEPGEELRILLVFAEAPGSRPLAMRQEREQLLALFRDEIQPGQRVRVDVLCHGVTRTALKAQVQDARGYHCLHWSGHGHRNRLELLGGDGGGDGGDALSGPELVDLLVDAGGFFPRIVFLAACHSGALVEAGSWAELRAALGLAQRAETGGAADSLAAALAEDSGYTGTALALLGAGIPQVVAMRYAVGDAYARRLARRFYRHLLGPAGQPADSALNQARKDLLDHPEAEHMGAADRANPLILGAERVRLRPARGRSPDLGRLHPLPQPLLSGERRDLEPRERFVGRGGPLTALNLEWLQGRRATALVQGLAGLGKTALAAEGIQLWHRRFDWVLCWQSRPDPLPAETLYRELDLRLTDCSPAYAEACRAYPAGRIWLEPSERRSGEARYAQMRTNLLQALAAEAVLLVLDNFEPNLADHATEDSTGDDSTDDSTGDAPSGGGYPCRDPEWERLLAALAQGLPGSRSRLLVTSRHRPAALGREAVLWLPLDPLPLGEAVLFLHRCEALAGLVHGDEEAQALARRVLEVSRGHPLILERLCTLAPEREALGLALDTLAEQGGYGRLPDLFARGGGRTRLSEAEVEAERAYLTDVAMGAVDLLLGRQEPEARRLLWVLALAGEPVDEGLLAGVWGGGSTDIAPRLAALRQAGLVHREGDSGPWECHELVRERARAWMAARPEETQGRSPEQVRVAYAERYQALFERLLGSGAENARDAAVVAGRRALGYTIRAGKLERLGSFASDLVISTRDPRLLMGMVQELRAVAEQVPEGKTRWSLRATIADGLQMAGRPDEALPFYALAASEAEGAEHWSDLGWITQNWAIALRDAGQLEEAKRQYRASAEAKLKAGRPEIHTVGSELESLRIEVMQGKAEQAAAEIDRRLERVRGWWQRGLAGESVPEAPEAEFLGRVMVGALDVARSAALRLEDWERVLVLLDENETVNRALGQGEHERARTRFNRYFPLLRLGRQAEAQAVLEESLALFRRYDDVTNQAKTLSALADLWDKKGDPHQAAALERRALDLSNRLPDPGDRARSHNNLAIWLHRLGETPASARHQLAALCYGLAGGYGDLLRQHTRNLAIDMAEVQAQGEPYPLPTLEALLADPEFAPLGRFLQERGIAPAELQQALDQKISQLIKAASAAP